MELKDQIEQLRERLDILHELAEMHEAYCESICAVRPDLPGHHTPRCKRLMQEFGFPPSASHTKTQTRIVTP